jgi:ADP-ribosyl-[dinitrogen reductase] hydrolase
MPAAHRRANTARIIRTVSGPKTNPPMPIADRATAAYLGLAIGDALGATVEFMLPREIAAKYGVHNTLRGGGWLHLKPGQVTDDTTMSLALGNSILESGKVNAVAAAHAFDAWMRAKPVDIGNTVRRNLLHFRKTGMPEAPSSDQDAGNGAAMRVLPVALATYGQTEDVVRAACRAQAHVTHHCVASDAACETLAFMVQDALRGRDKNYLLHKHAHPLAAQFPEFRFRAIKQSTNPSGYVAHTLQAVFQGFFDTDDFRDCLIDVVNRGGDADTTGAIAGMLAGALYGLKAIPHVWLKSLNSDTRHSCEFQAGTLVRLSNGVSQ